MLVEIMTNQIEPTAGDHTRCLAKLVCDLKEKVWRDL